MGHRVRTLLILAMAPACSVEATLYEGDHALAFDGAGCVEAVGEPIALGNVLTLELWFQSEAANADGALLTLGNAIMLWADSTGTGLSAPAERPNTGWQNGISLYDGALHHVAATWTEDGGGNLFIDGIRTGSGQPWSTLPAIERIALGCWPDGGREVVGVIDEVRISTMIRYPTNFNVPDQPFEMDENTLAIYHLDLGVGDRVLDAGDRFPGEIANAEWTAGLRAEGD